MRLLNTWLLKVEEFTSRNTPPYAILSHTWGEQEVLLDDIQTDRAGTLRGYRKIQSCCAQARQDGLEYVWIDTCCIDKTSSTELAEAINSMFTWYRQSIVCYALLEDINAASLSRDPRLLGSSRWFTRGWTLQELIAPNVLIFYDSQWKEVGSRDDLVQQVADATGIDRELLLKGRLSQYSIAQRMSWAAQRQTTRIEDEAYCLLGLFGVTMPLLYGEGKMAFIRLQEEIMKRSDDQSIFAWTLAGHSESAGLLAPSPACFADAGSISTADDGAHSAPFFITNKGIQITLPILRWGRDSPLSSFEPMPRGGGEGPRIVVTLPDSLQIAVLNCETPVGHKLGLIIDRHANGQYVRMNPGLGPLSLGSEDGSRAEVKTVLVKSHEPLDHLLLRDRLRPTYFSIQGLPTSDTGYEMVQRFGGLRTNRAGMVSGYLAIGDRGGVVFAHGERSFGIFIAETGSQSCWEMVADGRSEVEALAKRFKAKHETLMGSRALLRVWLGGLVISMETRRRPHGFSSLVRFGEKGGCDLAEGPIQDFLEGAGPGDIGSRRGNAPFGLSLLETGKYLAYASGTYG